jgi:hypothetical protein
VTCERGNRDSRRAPVREPEIDYVWERARVCVQERERVCKRERICESREREREREKESMHKLSWTREVASDYESVREWENLEASRVKYGKYTKYVLYDTNVLAPSSIVSSGRILTPMTCISCVRYWTNTARSINDGHH